MTSISFPHPFIDSQQYRAFPYDLQPDDSTCSMFRYTPTPSPEPMSGAPHTPMNSFRQHLAPSPPESPADSGYDSAKSTGSRSARRPCKSKKTKCPTEETRVILPNPEQFLPPLDYEFPQPRSDPRHPDSHVPRPPNSFLLFRTFLLVYHLKDQKIENKQQMASRMAARIWHNLPQFVRQAWGAKYREAVAIHRERYPDYRFEPSRKAAAKKSEAQLAQHAAYAESQLQRVFGAGFVFGGDASGHSSPSGPSPGPSQQPLPIAYSQPARSPYLTPSPSLSSSSSSLPGTPATTALQCSLQQIIAELESLKLANQQLHSENVALRSENTELKQRVTLPQATTAATLTPTAPSSPQPPASTSASTETASGSSLGVTIALDSDDIFGLDFGEMRWQSRPFVFGAPISPSAHPSDAFKPPSSLDGRNELSELFDEEMYPFPDPLASFGASDDMASPNFFPEDSSEMAEWQAHSTFITPLYYKYACIYVCTGTLLYISYTPQVSVLL
ncbi:HMG box domain-containing protein [Phanerochaete sordida]|uniref:HMG box domain-containing protein n=1 Tax=Phanerochaete sordida TaxID=48140 RepID=A0A9P3FYJ8_9APHY|nr:HMG box domain-containing protein [Phanerochaete sordida]